MRKILSCEFNPDTACVELRLDDGTLLAIDCTAVENEVAKHHLIFPSAPYFRAYHVNIKE